MMNKATIKTVIIEDDLASINLLTEFLKSFDFIEVIGKATTFKESEILLQENSLSIDLAILDIDLQGANSLDLIKYLTPQTKIVFTTSFTEFAVKAFEYNTIDYIVKPISFDRLKKALGRINIVEKTIEDIDEFTKLNSRFSINNMVLMNINNEMKFIKIKDINYIQAKGNYTNVSLEDGTQFVTYGLIKIWEDKLPLDDFFRVHRSTIVNLHNVIKIDKGTYDTGILYLKGLTEPFEVSRNYFSIIKNKFKLTSTL
ncbi:MAG: LytTR family DNA-binding domain-containing protein [Bacteroidota bacterium]